ncbi:ABC transporter substrate-binding protein [Agaricicola taiwanensis]|uniref:ABC transporter substrate-binding protein n=1 Tax=Agaricicola taiwanensis TaxID=591372 RepID=A0A8J2YF95_9RHOB|nr:ABC transporter substrate-binding protein [Agaricicola taiwanensis]GGE41050.1 ABC transporter substrate-binding protein [Agaricicola taiwanensis]
MDFAVAKGRRRMLRLTTLAIAALAGFGSEPALSQEGTELVIVTSGGTFEKALQKNFYEAFTAETGIKVHPVSASYAEQWAKARAMAESGRTEWDIVTVGIGEDAANRDLLEKLDCAGMPNVKTQAIDGACREYTLLRTIGGTVLAYNTDTFKEKAPASWADFWDVAAFPGPRAMPNYGAPYVSLAVALLADGAPLSEVRDRALDVPRAFAKLDKVKPDVSIWWKTGDQSQQAFRNGEVVMSMMWSGRAMQLQQAGQPIEVVWNNASAELSSWGILKNAPHKEAAKAFLNFFMSRPEAHLAFSSQVFWDTANRAALDKTYGSSETFMKRFENMITYDSAWLAENRSEIVTRWNDWISR